MYFFKQINSKGELKTLLTCDRHLAESAEQIEITEAEYNELYAALPQPEEPNEATEADYIQSLEELGVNFDE